MFNLRESNSSQISREAGFEPNGSIEIQKELAHLRSITFGDSQRAAFNAEKAEHLPNLQLVEHSSNSTKSAIDFNKLASEFGRKIFAEARHAHDDEHIQISGDGHFNVELVVNKVGASSDIDSDSSVSRRPLMNENALDKFVLNPALHRSLNGEFPHPIPIKLSLGLNEELSGALIFRAVLKD